MPLDHIAFAAPASKFDACVAFYVAALSPAGLQEAKGLWKVRGTGRVGEA